MLVRKYQWMGIVSIVLTLLLLSDPLIVRATETGTLIGEGTTEETEQYTVDEDEIWALIDRDELRSLIDVDELKDNMDRGALKNKVDVEPLLKQISEVKLLESMSAEEIMSDFTSLKESGELDELIKSVVESDEFDEEYIKNKPLAVPNVKIPITDGRSPLDYIVDPLGLLYNTDASRFGGGTVQEGANVLFRNTEGDYLFSDTSDMLKIVNKGTVPLQVTISAEIEQDGDVKIVDSSSMLEGLEPGLFMALVGEDGPISVLSEEGSIDITVVLDAVPDGTYTYKRDEETGEYVSELSENADESKFDYFSFGLKGECNSEANWSSVHTLPRVSVTWKTEPILTGWDEITKDLEEADKVKFEAYKKVKLEELREAELDRLIQIQIDDMIYEELDRLIDEEVERLALIRFEELKELAIRGELDLGSGEPGDSDGMLIMDEEDDAEGGDEDLEDAVEGSDGADGSDVGGEDAIDDAGAFGNGGADDDADETGEDSGAGMNSSAKASGGNRAVLGATRERIEFIESDGGDNAYDSSEVAGDDEVIETFDSEDGGVQEQYEDSGSDAAESGNDSESVIFF